jgi:hydroxyacid-oxoacid transhydrogenase
MGVDTSGADPRDAGDILAGRVIELMKDTGIPNALTAFGYGKSDVEGLVQGTQSQHRVTKFSPRPANAEDLGMLFEESMAIWWDENEQD